MKTETIGSLKDLQMRMPAIIQQYGTDNNFTQIALANPIIALERAGFHFTEGAKDEIEHYVRFGREGLDRLHFLKEDIYKHIVGQIDLNNAEQVGDALMRILPGESSDQYSGQEQGANAAYTPAIKPDRDTLIRILKTPPKQAGENWQDDLQPYSTLHPVIQLMIDYRKMQADNPPFAPAEQIPVIDEKLKQSPLKNVVFTLQRNNIN
jgi:hypothetical protein